MKAVVEKDEILEKFENRLLEILVRLDNIDSTISLLQTNLELIRISNSQLRNNINDSNALVTKLLCLCNKKEFRDTKID